MTLKSFSPFGFTYSFLPLIFSAVALVLTCFVLYVYMPYLAK